MDSTNTTSSANAKPSNRAAYLLLLGTVAAGSALLYNRIRTEQKTLVLRELPPPASNGHYGATPNGQHSAAITPSYTAVPAPYFRAPGNGATYTPPAPTVTVARPPIADDVIDGQIAAEEQSEAYKPRTNWRLHAYELAETLLLTLFIFVLMRTFIINYRIEGSSMEPNLHEGQHLIVNKAVYYLHGPERGDVIVFEYPYSLPSEEKDYIKRVIGVPGDTVECRPGEIVVNGMVIEESYNPNPWSYTCTPTTLSENQYFVLGDNRSASSDSHQWGILERKYIIGKAEVAYWPPSQMEVVPNADIYAPEPMVPMAQN